MYIYMYTHSEDHRLRRQVARQRGLLLLLIALLITTIFITNITTIIVIVTCLRGAGHEVGEELVPAVGHEDLENNNCYY